MPGFERSAARRRVGILAAIGVAIAAPIVIATATLSAGAQQDTAAWNTTLRYADGKEVHWRATPARGCDGSNIEMRLVNNSQSSGTASLKEITFECVRGGLYVGPERSLGSVAPGGVFSAPVLSCACAEKGGVKDLMSVNLDLVRNGPGSEKLAMGCTYTGNFINGQYGGQGVYACENGYRYEGNYTNGVINGQGTEKLSTGEVYTGGFENAERQGLGHMTFADGSVYDGNFVRGKRDGQGTHKMKDGSVYIGEWKNDIRAGQGAYTTGDQQWTYDGAWANNVRNGDGKLLATDGSYTFIGKFVNDRRTGEGSVTFGDGRTFKGAFANDQQIGQGELTFKDGRKITGQFRDHRPDGPAVETGPVATVQGTWSQGALTGKASVKYASGELFEGLYTGGKRNGLGTSTRLDGSKEECNWVDDVRQEPCTQITKDGKRIEFRSSGGATKPKGQ